MTRTKNKTVRLIEPAWRAHVGPVLAVLVFAAMIIVYVEHEPTYMAVLHAINEHPFRTPFLDTRFVTAQNECWTRGIDVYAVNPCDPLGRTQDYSPLWLRLPGLARSDRWTAPFGLLFSVLFLTSLFLIPGCARGYRAAMLPLGMVSHATAYAIERGNTDLLLFAATALVAWLLPRSPFCGRLAYVVVLATGLLKFYPLTVLVVSIRERWRIMLVVMLSVGLVSAGFIGVFAGELSRISANMATGYLGGMFGARGFPFGFAQLLTIYFGSKAMAAHLDILGVGAVVLFIGMTLLCIVEAVSQARIPELGRMLGRIGRTQRSFLLVGSLICIGCFFAHQNIGYRAIFLLLVLPGLLALAVIAPTRKLRRLYDATGLLVVFALWAGRVDDTLIGWVLAQVAWWWIICMLLALVIRLLASELLAKLGELVSSVSSP